MGAVSWRYFLCCLALAVAPGPDNTFVLAQSVAQGAVAGIWVTAGLCTGLCFHTALVAFGAAALLTRYPRLIRILLMVGGIYLLWIGGSAWFTVMPQEETAQTLPLLSPLRLYLRGIVMNICNPKVSLFFLAFLPQFTCPERGTLFPQFLMLGFFFALAAGLVFTVIAVLGGGIGDILTAFPNAGTLLTKCSSVVICGIGIVLLWQGGRPIKSAWAPETPPH